MYHEAKRVPHAKRAGGANIAGRDGGHRHRGGVAARREGSLVRRGDSERGEEDLRHGCKSDCAEKKSGARCVSTVVGTRGGLLQRGGRSAVQAGRCVGRCRGARRRSGVFTKG